MKVIYRHNEKLSFEFEAPDEKVIIQRLAMIRILCGDEKCGHCGSDNIGHDYKKTDKGYEYYSLRCFDCDAQKNYGQVKEGGLWLKTKDKDGNNVGINGWYIWQRDSSQGPDRSEQSQTDEQTQRSGIPF